MYIRKKSFSDDITSGSIHVLALVRFRMHAPNMLEVGAPGKQMLLLCSGISARLALLTRGEVWPPWTVRKYQSGERRLWLKRTGGLSERTSSTLAARRAAGSSLRNRHRGPRSLALSNPRRSVVACGPFCRLFNDPRSLQGIIPNQSPSWEPEGLIVP
jgi:hypothetical protein